MVYVIQYGQDTIATSKLSKIVQAYYYLIEKTKYNPPTGKLSIKFVVENRYKYAAFSDHEIIMALFQAEQVEIIEELAQRTSHRVATITKVEKYE